MSENLQAAIYLAIIILAFGITAHIMYRREVERRNLHFNAWRKTFSFILIPFGIMYCVVFFVKFIPVMILFYGDLFKKAP